MIAWWFRIPFWQRVAAGFVLGALVGWAMGPAAGTWLQPLGTLYVNLIRMVAVPLVFFAVVNAVSALQDRKSTRLNSSHVAISSAVSVVKKEETMPEDKRARAS